MKAGVQISTIRSSCLFIARRNAVKNSSARLVSVLNFCNFLYGPSISVCNVSLQIHYLQVELGAAQVNKDGADVKELKEQIACLKAALAGKEGEPELLQCSISSGPERYRTKAAGSSSPLNLNWSGGDMSDGLTSHRQPMDDVGKIEMPNNSTIKPKRQSFD